MGLETMGSAHHQHDRKGTAGASGLGLLRLLLLFSLLTAVRLLSLTLKNDSSHHRSTSGHNAGGNEHRSSSRNIAVTPEAILETYWKVLLPDSIAKT
jgi:hypothetical protein